MQVPKLITIIILTSSILYAQESISTSNALFEEESVIELKLMTDFKTLLKDKGEDPGYHEANLSYSDPSGKEVSVPIRIKVRGNFRRQSCGFPPLMLNFEPETSEGSYFAGQNKVKLVTHCQSSNMKYEQLLLQEYLVYKTYNIITDNSFRVRLVRVSYEDTEGKFKPITRFGFLIEDEDLMANRLGGKIIEVENIHPLQTNPQSTILLSIFEFMVGNTDWSIPGLHNVKLIQRGNQMFPLTVPYDFDWCGAVNAPYAKPNPMFDIPSVRIRVYRGMCRSEEEFQEAFNVFLSKKDDIWKLYNENSMLTEKSREQTLKYYAEFYDILTDPKMAQREIIENCRQ